MLVPEKKISWEEILKDYTTHKKYASNVFEYDKDHHKAFIEIFVGILHCYQMMRIKRGFEKLYIYFAQELITEKTKEQLEIEKFYLDTMTKIKSVEK